MTDQKQRKTRTDTAAGAVIAMQDAMAGPLEPPAYVKLRDGDRPFFDAITGARARNKWDAHDLAIAANLARSMADLEKLQEQLDREGHTVENARGTPVANPAHTVLETLTRRVVALSRTLHVHAEAKQGPAKLQGKAKAAQDEAAEIAGRLDDEDDLIPGISKH